MTKPIVLVHGAWHGGWCYERVSGPLRERGFNVSVVDLPLQGAAGDIAAARACIDDHPEAVVLGHSYGGFVITHATIGLDVSHLVYLTALMPDTHEDLAARIDSAPPATALSEALVVDADGRISINPLLAKTAFYDDCDPDDAANAIARLRPHLLDGFLRLEYTPAWRHVPCTYVICKDDRALHPDLQRNFAKQATHIEEWDGAHSPFLSQPERVIDLLEALSKD